MLYKKIIQRKILSIKRKNPSFRSAHLARKIGIEASYLSRFLSESSAHFSDDLLFVLLTELKASPNEIEQIITLKELERCVHPDRKAWLSERIKMLKIQGMRSEVIHLREELSKALNVVDQWKQGSKAL